MKAIKYKIVLTLALMVSFVFSCKDLDELNINPNGVDPADGHPNLLIATVLTETGKRIVDLGFGDLAGVMQHTQKDGWSSGHNDYDWANEGQDWSLYYNILRTNEEMIDLAEEKELDFHKGVGLVMKAYVFGLITDLWGDAPFTSSLKGEQGGEENIKPAYNNQREIYLGILAYLEEANMLFSRDQESYSDINSSQDVYFGGNVKKWRKLANSLALRYYMRISNKEAELAKTGIEKIMGDQAQYPVILSSSDDAAMSYVGASTDNSWPSNTVFDQSTSGAYNRIKMCATLIDTLKMLSDPRIGVYAEKIEIPLVLEPTWEDDRDEIINGERHIAQNIADDYEDTWDEKVNYSPEYIGMPPSSPTEIGTFNLNPDLAQGTLNPHCSQLNSMYKESAGDMLKARVMSASEVNFILSECALKGWSVGGSSQEYYNAGIKASFETWGVSGDYNAYITGEAAYDGTLEQLMQQKWIASWTAAAESWFDYRRTGFPDLQAGPYALRDKLPLRFYYMLDEINLNTANVGAAINALKTTDYTSPDPKNSAWSKSWILDGTGLPY